MDYTVWEAIKTVRQLQFDGLTSKFARSLLLVITSCPTAEINAVTGHISLPPKV